MKDISRKSWNLQNVDLHAREEDYGVWIREFPAGTDPLKPKNIVSCFTHSLGVCLGMPLGILLFPGPKVFCTHKKEKNKEKNVRKKRYSRT